MQCGCSARLADQERLLPLFASSPAPYRRELVDVRTPRAEECHSFIPVWYQNIQMDSQPFSAQRPILRQADAIWQGVMENYPSEIVRV